MIASSSVNTVLISSSDNDAVPIALFRHLLTIFARASQKPSHQGARSTIKCHVILLFASYRFSSSDRTILVTSLADDLKFFALSDNKIDCTLIRLENLRNACKNDGTSRRGANSK